MLRMFDSKKVLVLSGIVLMRLLLQRDTFAMDGWKRITELPTKREGFATAVVDGKIYLIGGSRFEAVMPGKRVRGPFDVSTVEAYDPQTNTWQHRAEMPTPRTGAKAAVVNGIIYVFGGFSGKDNREVNLSFPVVVEAYHPQTDTWIQKIPMPISRINFGIGVVASKVYLIGGLNGRERTDHVDVYNPATDTWVKGRSMPTRRDGLNVEVVNSRIYAIGESGHPPVFAGPFLSVIEEYTRKNHHWRKKKDMLALSVEPSTVVVRDAIYLIGGFVNEGVSVEYLATVAVYQPQTETWREAPPLPLPLIPFGAAAVHGKIYVFGGWGEVPELSPDVFAFDTGFKAVAAKGKLLTRWGHLKAQHTSSARSQ